MPNVKDFKLDPKAAQARQLVEVFFKGAMLEAHL
jgi:hypothetical protein